MSNPMHASVKQHQGHSGTRTARKICKKCNNGWIERLEERIRAPLTEIIVGESVVLDTELRHDIASWLALVTMMAEFMDPNTISIPPSDYQFLCNNGQPPAEWKIWIARYVGNRHDRWVLLHYGMQLAEFPDVLVEPHKCDTQVTTFVIGQLCVHTFRSTILGVSGAFGYNVPNMPCIWPPSEDDIGWPDVRELSDVGVQSLSQRLIHLISPAPFHGRC